MPAAGSTTQEDPARADESRKPRTWSILIVDDNDNVALLMQEMLENAGYNAITARDLESARRYLANVPVDLLILDWRLGSDCGSKLLDAMPKRNGLAIPVTLVATGSGPGGQEEQAALAKGAAQVMFKPFTMKTLKCAVATCLRCIAERPNQ